MREIAVNSATASSHWHSIAKRNCVSGSRTKERAYSILVSAVTVESIHDGPCALRLRGTHDAQLRIVSTMKIGGPSIDRAISANQSAYNGVGVYAVGAVMS